MGITQITQEIVAYTNSWKQNKEKILKIRKRGEEFLVFLLAYFKKKESISAFLTYLFFNFIKEGEYFYLISAKSPP